MAMIQCPECNKELSEKAHFCPHCGYPLQSEAETKQKKIYKLTLGTVSDTSGFATFLKVMAVVLWIGGLILAIIGGKTITIDSWGDIDSKFSFVQFLSIFLTYLINGIVLWCFAQVVDQVKETHEIVSGIKLDRIEEPKEGRSKVKTNDGRLTLTSSGITWRCKKCGTVNPAHSQYCQECGEYK